MKYNLSNYKLNSHFFYASKIDINTFEDFFITNISLKKINQKSLENLVKGISSSVDNSYLYLSTANGDFLFSSLNNYLKTNSIIDYLNVMSKSSNALYFYSDKNKSSMRFGFSKDGSLMKFISKINTEIEDPDDEIEWISKSNEIDEKFNLSKNKNGDNFNFDIIKQMIDYFLNESFENIDVIKVSILHKADEKIKFSETLTTNLFGKRNIDKLSTSSLINTQSKLALYGKSDFFITIDINKTNMYIHSFLLSEVSDSEYLFLNIASKIDKNDDFIAYKFNNSIVSIIDEIKHCEIKNLNYISRFIRKIPNDTKRYILSFNFIKSNKFTINLIHFPNNLPVDIYSCKKFNIKSSKEILDFIINLSPMDYISDY